MFAMLTLASLMIIDDLDPFGRSLAPDEANPPLIVDANAVLAFPVAAQCLEPASRNSSHVRQHLGVLQHAQLSPRHRSNVAEFAAELAVKEFLGLLAPEGAYQTGSIPRLPLNGAP
jgi:hypothetical protein